MYGAILGDMIGSPYEFDRGNKTKDFPLFVADSQFTDDTVMTIAVADALLRVGKTADDDAVRREVISSMQAWGREYPYAGYGGWIMGLFVPAWKNGKLKQGDPRHRQKIVNSINKLKTEEELLEVLCTSLINLANVCQADF